MNINNMMLDLFGKLRYDNNENSCVTQQRYF